MAGADNPAPTPSAAALLRNLRRSIKAGFMGFAVGFMSVSTPMCVLCGVGAAFAWQRLQLASKKALLKHLRAERWIRDESRLSDPCPVSAGSRYQLSSSTEISRPLLSYTAS